MHLSFITESVKYVYEVVFEVLKMIYHGLQCLWKLRTKEESEIYTILLRVAKRKHRLIREWESVTGKEFMITNNLQESMSSDFFEMTDFEITCKYAPIDYLRKTYGYGSTVVTKRIQKMARQGII